MPVLFAQLTREELLDLADAAFAALRGHDGCPVDPAWRAIWREVALESRRAAR